uniref:carbohydrate sulfotransferase 8 n=1 Tax=Myxine glutinosa TaxID=7769 RepID=UPI00358E5514
MINQVCARYRRGAAPPVTLASPAHVSRLFVEERHHLLYCEIPKAGCTNWKRLLMVLSGRAPSTTAVLHTAAHYANGLRRLDSYPRHEIERRLRTYTKVLFVREPLERLVSAFRDKLQRPNPYYGPLYGRAILARYRNNASRSALHSGTGVTFREFLRFLLDPHRPLAPDVHWEPAARLCHPCYITYDFIGHFEALASEADAFLAALGIPPTLRFPPKEHDVTEAVRTEAMHLSKDKGSFDISRQYFSRLLQHERQLAYDLYYLDYIMFNYSKPFSDVH